MDSKLILALLIKNLGYGEGLDITARVYTEDGFYIVVYFNITKMIISEQNIIIVVFNNRFLSPLVYNYDYDIGEEDSYTIAYDIFQQYKKEGRQLENCKYEVTKNFTINVQEAAKTNDVSDKNTALMDSIAAINCGCINRITNE